MTYYTDEQITIASGSTGALDVTKLDHNGSSRAGRAVIELSPAANTEVLYRFGADPVASPQTGHRLDPGESVTIDDYTNLRDVIFLAAGASSANLFVTYYT